MFDVVLFIGDMVAVAIITAALTWIFGMIGFLLPDEGEDPPEGGGGWWRYQPRGPRDNARRPFRGGPRSPLQPRPRLRPRGRV